MTDSEMDVLKSSDRLKQKVDKERVLTLFKFQQTVPYVQCYAGGDWECPVCFFIYFDGKKFRGYVPLKGNAINPQNHSAFQGHPEEENPVIRKELGYDKDDDSCKVNCENVTYNINACLEDFVSRLTVTSGYKKNDEARQKRFEANTEKFNQYKKRQQEEKEKENEMSQI